MAYKYTVSVTVSSSLCSELLLPLAKTFFYGHFFKDGHLGYSFGTVLIFQQFTFVTLDLTLRKECIQFPRFTCYLPNIPNTLYQPEQPLLISLLVYLKIPGKIQEYICVFKFPNPEPNDFIIKDNYLCVSLAYGPVRNTRGKKNIKFCHARNNAPSLSFI